MFDPADPTEVEDYHDYADGCTALEGFILSKIRTRLNGAYGEWVNTRAIQDSLFAKSNGDKRKVRMALQRLVELGYVERKPNGVFHPLSLLETLAKASLTTPVGGPSGPEVIR